MHKLQLTFSGYHCNDWPNLTVSLDGALFHDGPVMALDLILELATSSHTVVLTHHGKRFGRDRIWDTRSKDGIIIEDRFIRLTRFEIDGIDMLPARHKLNFVQAPTDLEPVIEVGPWSGDFNFNGSITIDINPTPLSWVTNMLHKTARIDASYFSDYSRLFHYERDIELIDEIKKSLDDIDV